MEADSKIKKILLKKRNIYYIIKKHTQKNIIVFVFVPILNFTQKYY